MKKRILSLALALLFLLLASCTGGGNNQPPREPEAPASDFEYKAIEGGIEITKYIGTSIRVRIPEKIEGVSVTRIGGRAFESSGIMEVYIPNSVTDIGNYAFNYNPGLTSITIPDSVTSIGCDAFSMNSLTSIAIPDSMTRIGGSAFCGNEGLTAIYRGITYTAAARSTSVNHTSFSWYMPQEFYDAINGS
jgi:hypothetical protein